MRAVLELAGIRDVLSKSLGSQNPINLVKATVTALQQLRAPDEVAELRGLTVRDVLGIKEEKKPPPEPEHGSCGPRGSSCLMKITQVKSSIGANPKQRGALRTLGLGKIGKSVERPDDPTVRGAVHSVRHLVKVED